MNDNLDVTYETIIYKKIRGNFTSFERIKNIIELTENMGYKLISKSVSKKEFFLEFQKRKLEKD